MSRLLLLMLAMLIAGCSARQPEVSLHDKTPLTIEEWKELDVLVKYELKTFERLKAGNPKLKKKKVWDQFMFQVVVPERKKDIPAD